MFDNRFVIYYNVDIFFLLRKAENMKKIYGLRYDLMFKKIFTQKELLKSFMKDIFHGLFWYSNKELTKENKNLRYGISDLIIEDKTRIMIIEIQNTDLKNLSERVKTYISGFYARQNPGKDYKKIKPVEAYLILNYKEGRPKLLKEYEQLEKTINEQFGNLSKIKIWNIREALKTYGSIDYHYARLFNLDELSKSKSKMVLKKLEKNFGIIIKEINKYNMDLSTYQRLVEIEKMEMSFELATSMIKHDAEEKGIRIGEKRGEKRGEKLGEAKGVLKNQVKIAKNMLLEGMSIEQILRITGMTRKQFELEFNKNKVSKENIMSG